jgi:glycosyltransferase involved in cell wall biosynthesis
MNRNGCRVLYLDGYTVPDPKVGVPSSDAIGYGITASAVIRDGLSALGLDVVRPRLDAPPAGPGGGPEERLSWILSNYRGVLRALVEDPPDVIFCFHIFASFPAEIRRMLLDLDMSIPVVGYTHGSHWDPTDTFRTETYPGMEVVDLANLHVLDRLLLVSEYMRTTLRDTIGAFNLTVAEQIDAHAAVVGLPLDVGRIDACRTGRRFSRPTVVFNHAPVSSKNPELFARVMARVLPHQDVALLITRDFAPWQPGGEAIAELAKRFPGQVILGRDMPLNEYFEALWAADLQVSTATHESLGVSTLEAMYTANCCILPRLGSYPELCNDHPDVLYEVGEGPLEERLRYFLEHPDRRRAVASELQRMTARYHPRVVVRKIFEEVLDVALNRP